MPVTVALAASDYFNGANFPFMIYAGLTHGAGRLVEVFGTDKQKDLFLKKMYSGEWTGTMLLTESDAGSDVGALATTAVKNDAIRLPETRSLFPRASMICRKISFIRFWPGSKAHQQVPKAFPCSSSLKYGSTMMEASASPTMWSAPVLKKKWEFMETQPAPLRWVKRGSAEEPFWVKRTKGCAPCFR